MKTMIKLGAVVCLLSSLSLAQGVRLGEGNPTQSTVSVPGVAGQVIVAIPNATINFCSYPANAVPCTNKVTTYTDISLTTPCAASTQVVLSGTNTCRATTDSLGNWGVWLPAGTYAYTVTASGASSGPYSQTSRTAVGCTANAPGLIYSDGSLVKCDVSATDDGSGNLLVKSVAGNGTQPSALTLGDASSSNVPASGLYLQSLNGVPNLWEMGVSFGHVETSSEEGIAGGVATLDNNALIPIAEMASNPASCNSGTVIFGDRHCATASNGGGGTTWPIYFSSGAALSASATDFIGVSQFSTGEAPSQQPQPRAATISTLYCRINQTLSGAMQYVITVRKGLATTGAITSSDTAITCTLNSTNTSSCSDLTHNFTVAAGDVLNLKSVPTGTPTTSQLSCSLLFQ